METIPGNSDGIGRGYLHPSFVHPAALPPLAAGAIDDASFRLLADNIPTLCWIGNGDGYIVWYNRRFHDYCGTTPEQIEGWGWHIVHDPERLPRIVERWTAAVASGEPFEMVISLKAADGTFRPFLTRAQPLRDASGNVARWFGINTDISGQIAAERALTAERDLVRGVIAAVPGVVFAKDRQGRLLVGNHGTERLIGLPAAAFVGKTDAELLGDPEQAAAIMTTDARIMASGEAETVEEVVHYPDGREATWHSTKAPLRDEAGTVIGLVGSSIDITDQIKARDVLNRSRAELAREIEERTQERDRLWRNSRDLLMIARADTTVVAVNPACTTVLGWDKGEMVGISYLSKVHPDELDGSRARAEALASGEQRSGQFELRLACKDGNWRWLAYTVVFEDGLFHAIARDVTDRKSREAELERAQDQLRQAQKMEAIGQLTGGLAHDFNNLLTIIRSSVDLLRRAESKPDKHKRYIDAISDTADRATALTRQLLAFARRQPLQPERFMVADRLVQTEAILRSTLGDRVRLHTEIHCGDCAIEADPHQFDTAILNLLVNARDAINHDGELTIGIDAADAIPERRGHPAQPGHFVAISVTDSGPGIPDTLLERIFEPFFTTKDVGRGTGLGLSQVFGFTKQSGGDVVVASEPGRGATFTLFLPRAELAPAATDTAVSDPLLEHAPSGRCVLVVEDNEAVGEFAAHLLDELGYSTRWAHDGQAARDILAANPDAFDLVFSDVVMPGISGLDLALGIRRDYPGLPVILTSGYSHVLVDEGTHGFTLLRKPYSLEALSQILRTTARTPTAAGSL